MTATSRIVSVRCGSDGPLDAGSVRRTTDNAPCYASLPTSVVEAFKQVVLSAELQPGERLLWSGRPDTSRWLVPDDLGMLPVGPAAALFAFILAAIIVTSTTAPAGPRSTCSSCCGACCSPRSGCTWCRAG